MQFKNEVVVIGAAYFGYFLAALIAIVLLAQYPEDSTVLEYAFQVVFVTSGLHFGFMLYGFTQPHYVVHPVGPQWLFLYSDYTMASALGATVSAYVLDHSNRTPAVIGNAVVLLTQMVCVRKTYKLLHDVSEGVRDPDTGSTRLIN